MTPEPPLPALQDLTTADLASAWQCSRKTIQRLLHRGLPHYYVGRLVRIDRSEATKWRSQETEKLSNLLRLGTRQSVAIDLGKRDATLKPMHNNLVASDCVIGFNKRDNCHTGSYRDPVSGKVKTKFISRKYATNETEARTWLVAFEQGLHNAGAIEAAAVEAAKPKTLASLFEAWGKHLNDSRTNREGKRLDKRTCTKWLGSLQHNALSQPIAQVPLTNESFTPFVVIAWIGYLKSQHLSAYYIRDCVLALRMFVDDARKLQWITLYGNPVEEKMVRSEVPQGAPASGKDNPIHLNQKEAVALLNTKAQLPFVRRVMTLVALCTGARLRELQGLAWKHIDLKEGTLNIERQIVKGGSAPEFKAPKRNSYRVIPLHKLALQALKALHARVQHEPNDPVFAHTDKPGTYDMWKFSPCTAEHLRTDLRAAGLADKYEGLYLFDFHATRRTFMTLLTNAGAPADKVSALAGHAKQGVSRHYVKDHLESFRPVVAMLPFKTVKLDWLKAS